MVRRGGGAGNEVDPFRMMRDSMRRMQDLFRWDPLADIEPLALFEPRVATFVPDFEVRETQDSLVFRADVPGVREDDIDVTVVGNRLRISGKREVNQEERGDTWYTAERSYGAFTRTFILPDGCDTENVNASLDNGVLTISLPKRAEAQPRRISLGQQQGRAIEGRAQSQGQQGYGEPYASQGQAQQQQAEQAQQPGQQQRVPEKV
jgi:HSP20 family protein